MLRFTEDLFLNPHSFQKTDQRNCTFAPPGPEIGQQWFDEFLVAFPDDTPIVKVQSIWGMTTSDH